MVPTFLMGRLSYNRYCPTIVDEANVDEAYHGLPLRLFRQPSGNQHLGEQALSKNLAREMA